MNSAMNFLTSRLVKSSKLDNSALIVAGSLVTRLSLLKYLVCIMGLHHIVDLFILKET